MSRVKRGVTSHARHKKVLDAAKGYYGRRKNTIRIAKQAVEKAGQYQYRDRKVRKRNFRALWTRPASKWIARFSRTSPFMSRRCSRRSPVKRRPPSRRRRNPIS
jgi:ribosomal protein L20